MATWSVDFVALLKACAKQKDLHKGTRVHAHIAEQGLLQKDCYVASTLVNMYATCGALAKAALVLDELPDRDVVSWSALITGYVQQGQGEEALKCFEQMQCEGLSPDTVTFISILKACGIIRAADKGKRVHEEIARRGLLGKDIVLGNSLVDMYAKCGELAKAAQVLDELPLRNAVTWNALIAGYTQQGQNEEALKCFERMQSKGISPDSVTFICALKACGSIAAAEKGEQIHKAITRQGFLRGNISLGTALLDMYAKCGALAKAADVLDELPVRDVVCWSALIAGYAQQGRSEEALKCFEQMQQEGLSPDTVTLTYILKACGNVGALDKGAQVHDTIARQQLEKDFILGTTLVEMYAKCGALAKAAQLLEELPTRNVVSWNALITGYVQQGQGEEALNCFKQMQREGLSPDTVTFLYILQACGSLAAADQGELIHDKLVRQGLLGKDAVLGNCLVDMYAKCGALAKAARLLDELPVRDVVSWSVLIAGYAKQGHGDKALECFERMQREGLSPNTVTFVCILKACASIGAADKGKQIYDEIVRRGLLGKDIVLDTTLVNMFAKCGALAKAAQVLDELPVQNVVSWNALIAGYAQQGQGEEALKCFEKMQQRGFSPDEVTLVGLLSACSRAGMLYESQNFFKCMGTNYGITADVEHHTCMVDLLSRAGEFDKAFAMIKKMPFSDYLAVWHALLDACRQCGNVKLGRLAFDNAVQINKNDASAYALMAAIYAAAGMQKDANNIEVMREK